MTNLLSAAPTPDDTLNAIRQQVQSGGDTPGGTSPYVWMALTALALSILLLIVRWYRGYQTSRGPLNDPAKLNTELRKRAAFTRRDLRQFKKAAAKIERKSGTKFQNPLVLALCPSLTKSKQ